MLFRSVSDGRVRLDSGRISLWFQDGDFSGNKLAATSPGGYMYKSFPQNSTYRTAYEFEIESTQYNELAFQLGSSNNRDDRVTYTIANKKSTGHELNVYNNNASTSVISKYGSTSLPAKMNFTLVLDSVKKTYNVYLDGILVAENFAFYSSAGTDIGRLTIRGNKAGETLWLDNVKIYRVEAAALRDDRPPMVTDSSETGITDANGYLFYEDFNHYTGGNSVTVSKTQYPSTLSQSNGMLAGSEYLQPVEQDTGGYKDGSKNSEPFGDVPIVSDGKVTVNANNRMALWFYGGDFTGDKTTSVNGYMNTSVLWNATYKTAFEFDVEHTGNGDFSLRLTSPDNRDNMVTVIAVHKNNNKFAPTINTTESNVLSSYGSAVPEKMNVTIISNYNGTTNTTYNVYLNGILVAENYAFRASAGTDIGRLYIQVNGNTTISVDNVKVYRVGEKVNNNARVDADQSALSTGGWALINQTPQDSVYESFSYTPTNGSFVKYTSDVPGLINPDGTINTPKNSTNANVKVTIYYGRYEKIVNFACTIASEIVIEGLDALSGWGGLSGSVDNEYLAMFPAYATDGQEHEVLMIIAAYEGNKLIACNAENVTVYQTGVGNPDLDGEEYIFGVLSVPTKTVTTTVKAFVWENDTNLRPLVSAE